MYILHTILSNNLKFLKIKFKIYLYIIYIVSYHKMLVSMKEDNKDPTAFGIKAQVNNRILFLNVSLSSSEFSKAS